MDLIENNVKNPINHWYYVHKYRYIKKYVSNEVFRVSQIVDVGAGSALFSLELLKEYPNLKAIAVDINYSASKRRESNNRVKYTNDGSDVCGELYLFTDVLEHVIDDVQFLSDYVQRAPSRSKFIITVPAFMSLWSEHDVYLKHFRRYRKKHINAIINQSGLNVVNSQFIYSLLFPVAWLRNRVVNLSSPGPHLKEHSRFVNWIMKSTMRLDYGLSRLLPFGISIVIYAEKKPLI